jgi:hypothetical protein
MPQLFPELKGALVHPRSLTQGVSTQGSVSVDIEQVVGRVRSELQLLLTERAAIVKRIRAIKLIIVGLADVFGADVVDKELLNLISRRSRETARSDQGLTDVCRRTLMEPSEPLTTRQVCDLIQETTPSVLARQTKPTNSVTVVLRRLVSYGEVKDGVNEKNVRTWQWIGSRQRDAAVEPSSLPDLGGATDAANPSPS